MATDEKATGSRASVENPAGRALLRLSALGCWAWVAVIPLVLTTGEHDAPGWGTWLLVAGILLVPLPLGFVLWSHANQAKRETARPRNPSDNLSGSPARWTAGSGR
ncbi:hypothetical protein ACPZ19_09945 [Amycolatopsis lurida]